MMKWIFFLLLFLQISLGHSQSSIKGRIYDKGENKPLTNASVILLTAQDSIMKSFTRTDEEGNFNLNNIAKGTYTVFVTYPKFELYSVNITAEDNKIDLKEIKIDSRKNVLEEIVITRKLPINIKGDTLEYNAASFETEKNAKLEDLLRRLPGLSVSADGNITAQGKTVSKVLIDGEEFFGYDPKIAIRNVRADAVDKVQVYEKRSEEAELTGIDDGVRIKTVNVVLKEEARKGIFGNANANIGTHGLFDANLFAAKFNKTERIGLTGNWSNMGQGGDARIRSNSTITGNPEYKNIGFNYDNNFLQKKLALNTSYNFNDNSNANERSAYNKQILPQNTQETTSKNYSDSENKNNNFRSQLKFKIDSTQQLDLQLNAGKSKGENNNNSERFTTKNDSILANNFKEENRANSSSQNADFRMNYRKRLNRDGRSVNIQVNGDLTQSESNALVQSTTNYFSNNLIDSIVEIDQNRSNSNNNNRIGGSINFNDKIIKDLYYSVGYNFNSNQSKNQTDAFDNNSLSLDSLYSKKEENNNINNGFNLQLTYNLSNKLNISLSNSTSYRTQKLMDSYRDINLSRNFWNNNVNMNLNYRIKTNKNITANFTNSNNIPSFAQLLPLQPVTNPLFQQLGNPNLKKSTTNSYNASFNSFSILRSSSFNINTSISTTSNPIANKRIIDSLGVTTSSFENISNKLNWSARLYSGYSKPLFNNLLQFNPNGNIGYTNSFDFLNGELNNSKNYNASIGFSLSKQTSKVIDFNFASSIGLDRQETILRSDLNNNTFRANISTDIKYFLPFKFDLVQVLNYGYTGKNKVFQEAINQFYMNLELNKKLLSNNLQASLKAFDLFKSYNIINRSFDSSNFSESQQQMLTQYFMLGLKWDFNKNLGKKND